MQIEIDLCVRVGHCFFLKRTHQLSYDRWGYGSREGSEQEPKGSPGAEQEKIRRMSCS